MTGGVLPDGTGQIGKLKRLRLAPFLLAGEPAQARKHQCRHGVAGGHRAVIDFLPARNQLFPVCGIGKQAARFAVEEMCQQFLCQPAGGFQIGDAEGRAVQLQQAPGIEGIVVQLAGMCGIAVPPARQQTAVFIAQIVLDKVRCLRGRVLIVRLVKNQSRAGKCRDHQAVPRGEHLVIPMQCGPTAPVVRHLFQHRRHVVRLLFPVGGMHQVENIFPLKIAAFRDAEAAAEACGVLLAQNVREFIRREHIVFALCALAVRILSAVKPAHGVAQLSEHIIQGAAGDLPVIRAMGLLPRLGIGHGEQRVVIQHFFKVRREPLPVGRIAGKAAAHMVKHAAAVHVLERLLRHFPRVRMMRQTRIAQQKQQIVRRGKFGRAAKAAPLRIEQAGKRGHTGLCQRTAGRFRLEFLLLPQVFGQGLSGGEHIVPIVFPEPCGLPQQRQQLCFGQIGSRPEWLLVGCEQNGQRPAARAVHGDARRHIHRIHVGTLLPVHLYRDEFAVDEPGHFLRLEGLMCHDMTPVTGGVADAEKNRLVLFLCCRKGSGSPRAPVHGIFRMLKQIGRFFVLQLIHCDSPAYSIPCARTFYEQAA